MIYRALRHRFTFSSDHPQLSEFTHRWLASLAETPSQTLGDDGHQLHPTRYDIEVAPIEHDGRARLLADGQALCETTNPAEPFRRLIREVNVRAVQASASDYVVLHAGAVSYEGRSVVFPQAPMAGKSTLVAGLMRRGWNYVSDELVAIDPVSLEVSGLPRAITLRPGSWDLFPDGWIEPAAEALRFLPQRRFLAPRTHAHQQDLRPGHAALYAYAAGSQAPPDISPMDAVEMLRHLLGASFTLRDSPPRDLTTLARFVEQVDSWGVRAGPSLMDTCHALAALRRVRTEPGSKRP